MSKKHKTKLKHKHGETISELDFTSKLTPDECIEYLRAGRSPLRRMRLRVEAEKNEFCVEWIKASYANSRRLNWTEGVWFEGALDPQRDGRTRVHGRVLREFGSTGLTATAQTLTVLGPITVILTAALIVLGAESQNWWYAVAWGVLMAGLVLYFIMRKQRMDRLTVTLSQWINERLNV